MKKKYKSTKGKKKQSFKFLPILLIVVASAVTIFIAQQTNQKLILKSSAQVAQCTTPGGCGGDCNPNQNLGCGYGGCRYWEYCADENKDGVYSCHWKTASDGYSKPEDYSGACKEKANITSSGSTNPTATRIPTQKPNTPITNAPPTATPKPQQNVTCNNAAGCGGNCDPSVTNGCGLGGCRFWEYCSDEKNSPGVYTCHWKTQAQGYAKPEDYPGACRNQKPSTSTATQIPTAIPLVTNAPTPTAPTTPGTEPTTAPTTGPTSTPRPNEPTPTPIANLDMSKLCIPLEIHGNPSDKMDLVMIPINYSDYNRFAKYAQLSLQRMRETNLNEYNDEVLNKMNWYMLNTNHSSIPTKYRGKLISESEQDAFVRTVTGLCPHDRYVYFIDADILESGGGGALGIASFYSGFQIAAQVLDSPGPMANAFTHEWGHAASGLFDEYDAGYDETYWGLKNEFYGYNCTLQPNELNPGPDPCPYGNCNLSVNDSKYKKACPAWDCTKTQCDDLQKELFMNAGCYQRCGSQDGYRSAPVSIMDAVLLGVKEDNNKFNPPSLYSIIRKTFERYH